MFRPVKVIGAGYGCFPRARGDVPPKPMSPKVKFWFSPRTRGCSWEKVDKACYQAVFPAHAGMFRLGTTDRINYSCFPRARGDVPDREQIDKILCGFSPRTRGCSFISHQHHAFHTVFPAHAGMFLSIVHKFVPRVCFPRARGDVPAVVVNSVDHELFSPRTRGCSFGAPPGAKEPQVFPAHAGMFLL